MQKAAAIARLGTESAFEVLARANALAEQGRSIINLGIGQPDFPTPEHIVEAGVKALRDGHHGYTAANGIKPLREAVAADIKRYRGVEVSPERVVITPGGKVTMAFAMMLFGEPGSEILYPDPGFPIYRSMIAYTGAKPVPVKLHEDRAYAFSAEEVLSQITPNTRLLIVNSPANPTGGVTPKSELEVLARGLVDHPQVVVLSDEIYSRMVYDDVQYTSLMAFEEIADRLIVLDGWSKTYAMTGWRLGWGLWPAALVEDVTRLAINTYSCVNAAAQWAAIAALTGTQEPVERMMTAFSERRVRIMNHLSELSALSCPYPGGAFYCFPNIGATGLSSRELQDGLLEEAGVATLSGRSFGEGGEGYLRLSYAASLDAIDEAMARLRDYLERRV